MSNIACFIYKPLTGREEAIRSVTCTPSVMPVTFTNFLEQISHNLDAYDGPRLAYLLRVTGPHVKDLLREFKNPTVSTSHPRLGEEAVGRTTTDHTRRSLTVARAFEVSGGD